MGKKKSLLEHLQDSLNLELPLQVWSKRYSPFLHLNTANVQVHLFSLDSSPNVVVQTSAGRKHSQAKEPEDCCHVLCLSLPGSKTDP